MPKLSIEPALKQKCPRVALGLVTANVTVQENSAAVQGEMQHCESEILKLRDPRSVLESPKILATRSGYKALGKDPARYRGSAEALIRRILSGKHLPQINTVVDIINLVSVETRLSIGLYDLDHVKDDITFRTGRAGETYKGIGKYDLNLEDLPVFSDADGPHGSPTSDSERTMVTLASTHVAAILISFVGVEALPSSCERTAALFAQYADGQNAQIEIIQ
jgi:DNA/RNA-binding domain of Phe-tRNA-synthetase-like protein